MRVGRLAALVLAGVAIAAAPAAAQPVSNTEAALPPAELGIKYQLSLMVSAGLDLDVLGEVVTPGLSCNATEGHEGPDACRQQSIIYEVTGTQRYPNVYAAVPRRFHASAGFGIFQRQELIVQVSRNRSTAEPNIRIGRVLSGQGDRDMRATFSTYEDFSIEGGLRHYFRAAGKSKKYVNLTFGRRTTEAITAELVATGTDANLGTVRFYDKATRKTAAIVFGITYEPRGPLGLFLEAGFRWTDKLPRNDTDLGPLGLGALNDAGSRLFMPANFGVVLRF